MSKFQGQEGANLAEPVFDHPWQAQAFSMLVALNQAGHFAWKDWVTLFSGVIQDLPALAEESPADTYYRQWACALEKMVVSLGVVVEGEITERQREWHQAYLNTPHGMPVHLLNAACPPHRPNVKSSAGTPLTISAASASLHSERR